MALTPRISTARANESPDLGQSPGLGSARQAGASAKNLGSQLITAGSQLAKQRIDILNKKQDQDDNLNGFNFGVEYNTRAAQILQEETQVHER